MRNVLLFLMLMITVVTLDAQSSFKKDDIAARYKALSFLMGANREIQPAAKTTWGVTSKHVIAQSTRDNTANALVDSVALTYSPHNGSTYDYNTMIFPYNYTYNTTPMFNFEGVFTKPQVLYDSYMHWTLDPTTVTYGPYENTYATYDSNKNLTTFHDVFIDSVTNNNTSYINKFNLANNISSGDWFIWIGGVRDSAFKQYFAYDTTNRLVKDSTYEYHLGAWHLAARTLYTYSAANDLVQIDCYGNSTDTSFTDTLLEQLQYINTYDASHRLLTVATNIYNGTALLPSGRDTLAYTGAHTFNTAWRDYQYDNINAYWAPMFNMTKTLNTAGYPDTVNVQGFDSLTNSWVPQTFYKVKYDTATNPDTLFEYDFNFVTFPSVPDYTTIYYYDTFRNVASVPMVNTPQPVVIYPNPAHDNITISCAAAHDDLSITIMDISGHLLYREKLGSSATGVSVSLAGWMPGLYQVIVRDALGKVTDIRKVVKE